MGVLTVIGFQPGRSPFHRLDPRTKQALLMGLGGISLWGNWVFMSSFTIVLLCAFSAAGLSLARMIREIRFFLYFLVLVFGVRALDFSHGWLPAVSTSSAAEAVLVCWRLLQVSLMGLLLMATTRIADIRAALAWYLKPIPIVDERMAATMVGLLVRFLPVILFQAAEMSDAQRARCVEGRKNPLSRLMLFASPLLRRVFMSADELALAMQARCFSEQRTLPTLRFSGRDASALGIASLIALTVFLP